MILRAFAILALFITPASAQGESVAKGVDVVAGAASGIATDGGLWGKVAIVALGLAIALVVVLAWAVAVLFKRLQDVQDKRATEGAEAARQVAQTSISGTGAIADGASRALSLENKLQILSDKLLRLPEDLARGLANQDRISGDVRANGDTIRDLVKGVNDVTKNVDTLSGRVEAALRNGGRAA